MTIHLPKDLDRSIQSVVRSGRFASADQMVAEIVRAYLQSHQRPDEGANSGMGLIGALRDDAELLD